MTKHQFVLELGRAMHALGSPAYRVEDAMAACSRSFGLVGNFFATPTAIFLAVGEPGEDVKTTLLRVAPGDHDLGRLAALYDVRDRVVAGETSSEHGLQEVRAVLGAPPSSWWNDVIGQALVGAGAAALFGGGPRECGVAAAAGLLAGLVGIVARRRPSLGDVQAALTCAVVAFFTRCMGAWCDPLHVPIATLAAIIVLLPGLSFTTALAELAMRHLAAGSARLMGAMAVFVTMAIGVGIGDRCAVLLVGQGEVATPEPLAFSWLMVALAVNWIAFVMLLRATMRQSLWVLLAIAAGFGGARLGNELFGAELGAVVGAMAVALLGNVLARWRRTPAAIVRTPGLLLLVPGSLGLSGLTTAISGDFDSSAPFVFRMLLVGGSIVAGLLFAGVVVPPPLDVEPSVRIRSHDLLRAPANRHASCTRAARPMNLSPRRVSSFFSVLFAVLLAPANGQDRIEFTKDLYPGAVSFRPVKWVVSRVVDDLTGAPIAGAEVFFIAESETPIGGEFWYTRKFKTDADGWLRAPVGDIQWHIQVLRHPQYGTCSRSSDVSEIWRVCRAFDMPVLLTDWCNRPVAGANLGWCVSCGHTPDIVHATTDANGVAVLRGVDPQSSPGDIYVQHPGLQLGYDSVRWFPGDPPARMECGWAPIAEGKVLDHQGKPVAGAFVRGGGYHRGPWGRTANDGSFSIFGLKPDEGVHQVRTKEGRDVWFDAPLHRPVTLTMPAPDSEDPDEGTVVAHGAAPAVPETRTIGVKLVDGPDYVIVACDFPHKPKGIDLEESDVVVVPKQGPCLITVVQKVDGTYHDREFGFVNAAQLPDPVELRWLPDVQVRGRAVDESGRALHVKVRWRSRWSGAPEDDGEQAIGDFADGSFALGQDGYGMQLLEIVAQRQSLLPRLLWVRVPARDEQAVLDLGDVVVRSKPQLRVVTDDGAAHEIAMVAFQRPGWQEYEQMREFPLRRDGAWLGPDLREGDAVVVRIDKSAVPFRTVLEGAGPWQVRAPTGWLRIDVANGLANDAAVTCVIGDYSCRLRDAVPLIGLPKGSLRCYVSAVGYQTAIVDTKVTDELHTVRVELPPR